MGGSRVLFRPESPEERDLANESKLECAATVQAVVRFAAGPTKRWSNARSSVHRVRNCCRKVSEF
jgi:hypothetical protein